MLPKINSFNVLFFYDKQPETKTELDLNSKEYEKKNFLTS